MNLIGEPWIPVVFQDGKHRLVGLHEAYEQATEIRGLAVSPPQRVALMRLLLCITHASLDGPEDEEDWRACRESIVPKSLEYLNQRKKKFELFGRTPFLQVASLATTRNANLDKLDQRLAAPNNPTLFDWEANEFGRDHPPAWIALQ